MLNFLFLLGFLGAQLHSTVAEYSISSIKIIADEISPYYNPVDSKHFLTPDKEKDLMDFRDHYFNTVEQVYTLKDGRKVNCRIPLVNSRPVFPEEFTIQQRNLTKEQADLILGQMKGICANYRTPTFLWDFCFQEYVRQYDDDITIINAGKQNYAGGPELIFLGFFNFDDAPLYHVTTPQEKKQHRLYKKTIPGLQNLQKNTDRYQFSLKSKENFIYSFGKIVRYQTNRTLIPIKDYILNISVPVQSLGMGEDFVLSLDGKNVMELKNLEKLSEYTQTINGKKYYKFERLVDILVNDNYFLVNTKLPENISTSIVEIKEIDRDAAAKIRKNRKKQVLNRSEMTLHGNYLLGLNTHFVSQRHAGDNIFFKQKDGTFIQRYITKVWDENIAELNAKLPEGKGLKIIEQYIFDSYGQRLNWTMGTGNMTQIGRVVFGDGTNFKNQLKVNDSISISGVPRRRLEIDAIYSNDLLLLKPTFVDPKDTKTGNFVFPRPFNYSDTITNNEPTFGFGYNLEAPTQVRFSRARTGTHCDICHPANKFKDGRNWMLQFKPKEFDEFLKSSLRMYLSSEYCKRKGIEITMLNIDRLIITQTEQMTEFQSSYIIKNVTKNYVRFAGHTVWIIYSEGRLRIGYSDSIRLSNQLIEYVVPDSPELNLFSFDNFESYNLHLEDILVSSISLELSETLRIMSNTPEIKPGEIVSHFETYTGGAYCEPRRSRRNTTIEYTCAKNGEFMTIEEVSEPSTCNYHVKVGTNLLCHHKQEIDEVFYDNLMCTLKKN